MQLFYTPNIDLSADKITLSKEESKHIVRVLRLRENSPIYITDGNGLLIEAKITDANQNACEVLVTNRTSNHEKREYYIHMAVAPTKNNDRYEWFLEKATEIGIDEITPIISHHSERKNIKIERFKKVILAGAKQSLKAYIPKINDPTKLKVFLEQDFDGGKYIAHCIEDDRKSLKSEMKPNKRYLILIGPEGDFDKEEVELAIKKGFTPVTLGNFRLRTETAALAAVHSAAFINE